MRCGTFLIAWLRRTALEASCVVLSLRHCVIAPLISMDEERRRRLLLNYDRLLGGHLVGNVDHKLEDYALSTWLLLRMFRENIGYVR